MAPGFPLAEVTAAFAGCAGVFHGALRALRPSVPGTGAAACACLAAAGASAGALLPAAGPATGAAAGWATCALAGLAGFVAAAFTIRTARELARAYEEAERAGRRLAGLARVRADELREKELQLARAAQLATLGTLAAGVAHEINNPLAYLAANLNQLASMHAKGENGDEAAEILLECREGVARVKEIAADLFRMARLGSGPFEPVELEAVVRSVLPIVRSRAPQGVQVELRSCPTPPVRGNPRMLGQVVLNLGLNAVEALRADCGRARRVTIELGHDAAGAWIEVRDTGPGIPPKDLPHIFDPFYTARPGGAGTGLGLAVTRRIVKEHGGRIEIVSGAEGTRARVHLPLASRQAREGPAGRRRP